MRATGQFISYYQVSFVNLGNLDYIMQRASDGLWTDARYYEMLPEVKTIDRRGAVHNFRPDKDWAEQAALLLQLVDGQGFKFLCGDYESGVLNEQAAKDFWCFLCRLEEQQDKKVIFYTTIYKLRDNLMRWQGQATLYGNIDWEYFDFWLAQYPVSTNSDGTTTLHGDPQVDSPYLSIGGVVVRELPQLFWQYWADGNKKGAKYGCGSRDTNLDVFNGTVAELDERLGIDETLPEVPETPPTDACGELRSWVSDLWDVVGVQKNEIDFNYNATETNVAEIEKLGKFCPEQLGRIESQLNDDVRKLNERLDEAFVDITTQAQEIEDLNTKIEDNIKDINTRIYGLKGGHTHFWQKGFK